ncbi:hypothetical protein [Streptomyces syringium]|uniref:hypothetical protein n=1 Tax=Streptomyces syringium TaxID=76729 RepID=UPI0033A08207
MSRLWTYLEERTGREVDANVLRDRRIPAVKVVLQALRPLELGLREAERPWSPRSDTSRKVAIRTS